MLGYWKPYFLFVFCSGLRQGEQIGLKPEEIDWSKELIYVWRTITLDENGRRVEGKAKNRYSRRTIKLKPVMVKALKSQKTIYDQPGGEYFFCSPTGTPIHLSNLRHRFWIPAFRKDLHWISRDEADPTTFATLALSCDENPLWIAKIMEHRDKNMIIKAYSKYVENVTGSLDGLNFDAICQGIMVSKKGG